MSGQIEIPGRNTGNPYWLMFKFIEANDRPTTGDVSRHLGISLRTARAKLKVLRAAGFIFCDGRDPGFRRSPRQGEGTWVARNAYGAAMLATPFPIPRKPWPGMAGDS